MGAWQDDSGAEGGIPMKGLPPIAQVEVGTGGTAELAAAFPDHVQILLRSLRRRYTRLGLSFADRLAHRWLEENGNPYLDEIHAMAARAPSAGIYLLNMGCEIACTSAAVPAKAGGFRLVRVLDWCLAGAGRTLVLARQHGPAGSFLNLTWPGFSGVLTAMAEGRFAAAINQPPTGGLFTRLRRLRRGGIPPAHLLRQVFETAPDYEAARRMLIETRLAAPAFFTLVGPGPSEGCIIERTPFEAAVRPAPAAVANHWLSMSQAKAPDKDSHNRQQAMERLLRHPPNHFHWLAPPVLNKNTRLVVLTEPSTGFLRAQGYEKMAPATRPLTLEG
jgi:hypothetical protein